MLRSYEYIERPYAEIQMQNNRFVEEEIKIAREFCDTRSYQKEKKENCPVCSGTAGQYFFTKWGVEYLYCEECGSIYTEPADGLLEQYRTCQELISLRVSDEYQRSVAEHRHEHWEELLEWIQFRTFRFLNKREGLSVLDIGNRYRDYVKLIQASELCGKYELTESILGEIIGVCEGQADLALCFDYMQQEMDPFMRLRDIYTSLASRGLLILGTRVGSGFDILTLKENNRKIYPYEHILLPSVKGLIKLIERAGFRVLEITTPGIMDVQYVKECKEQLDDTNLFIKNLLESDEVMLHEFQRFLQKNSMSSYAQIIAQKAE